MEDLHFPPLCRARELQLGRIVESARHELRNVPPELTAGVFVLVLHPVSLHGTPCAGVLPLMLDWCYPKRR